MKFVRKRGDSSKGMSLSLAEERADGGRRCESRRSIGHPALWTPPPLPIIPWTKAFGPGQIRNWESRVRSWMASSMLAWEITAKDKSPNLAVEPSRSAARCAIAWRHGCWFDQRWAVMSDKGDSPPQGEIERRVPLPQGLGRMWHGDSPPQGEIERRGGPIGRWVSSLSLVLSFVLFLVALFLPAVVIEGRRNPGFWAMFIGYFCMGVLCWPSHLLCVGGWIQLARRNQVAAAICGMGALYGPLWWLWLDSGIGAEFRTRSFPSGWVWLTSVLILALGSCLALGADADS
jgi:hypothetical protein